MAYAKEHVVDELRDLLNWVAVFEEEYDLPAEVRVTLRDRVERIAEALEDLEVDEEDFDLHQEFQERHRMDEEEILET